MKLEKDVSMNSNCRGCFGCEKNAAKEIHECPYNIAVYGDKSDNCYCCDDCKAVCCGMIPKEKLPQIPKGFTAGNDRLAKESCRARVRRYLKRG